MAELAGGDVARELMKVLGYTELYPPQRMAIEAGVEDGQSLVVASPTASGKTFIALLALASSVRRTGRKSFYTAPLRSIASEKYREFKEALGKLGLSVGISIGDYDEAVDVNKFDVIVTTYEKLDSMIRNSPSLLEKVGCLVVDEIHYVDDDKRGPVIETLLSKVLYRSQGAQVVALSATVPNAEEIAKWLGARLVKSDWRPVPLSEGVYKDGTIFYSDGRRREVEEVSANPSLNLVVDINREGGQALVFVQSRRKAVQLAKVASKLGKRILSFDEKLAGEYAAEMLETQGPRALREELAEMMLQGVAYHHAGLSNEERAVIEEAFRRGALAAIFATPTLAAGVNLPARRVVVAEYVRYEEGYWRPIKVFEYKQFAGRAGRPGLDPYGEAVIVAMRGDDVEELMDAYIRGKLERVESRLYGLRGLRHSVLGAVASGIATKLDELMDLHRRTLYSVQRGEAKLAPLISRAVKDLVEWGLLEDAGGALRATELGAALARTYLDPESVPKLRSLAGRIKKPTVATLLYLVSAMPDMTYVPTTSSEADKIMDMLIERAPELVDVVEWSDLDSVAAVKTALVLWDWIDEASEDKIVETYDIGPGDLASAVDSATWISSALASIAPLAGLGRDMAEQLKILSKRIESGVRPELLPLVEIPGVGRVRARRLYNAGFKTLDKLATARPEDLLRVPGIGQATVASILEFFGRKDEAARLRPSARGERRAGPGLEGFMS